MKIDRLDLDELSKIQQLRKVQEEFEEVVDAYYNKEDDDVVEELWDLIQSAFGLLFKFLPSFLMFKASYTKHKCKMRKRNNEERVKVSEWIEL